MATLVVLEPQSGAGSPIEVDDSASQTCPLRRLVGSRPAGRNLAACSIATDQIVSRILYAKRSRTHILLYRLASFFRTRPFSERRFAGDTFRGFIARIASVDSGRMVFVAIIRIARDIAVGIGAAFDYRARRRTLAYVCAGAVGLVAPKCAFDASCSIFGCPRGPVHAL